MPGVHVDEDALRAASSELAELLQRVRTLTAEMSTKLAELAAEPGRYVQTRAELDRLDAERRDALQRLGERAAAILVVRAALSEEPVLQEPEPRAEPMADAAPQSEPRPGESARQEQPPTNAFARFAEVFSRRTASSVDIINNDSAVLHSLANHVTIAPATPPDLGEEVAMLERATSESRVPAWKKMSKSLQVRWLEVLVAWTKALEGEAREPDQRACAFRPS